MNFGQAIEALKNSKKVARKGWNGKGMFVYYVPAGNFKSYTEIGKSIADKDDLVHYNSYFAIKNVKGMSYGQYMAEQYKKEVMIK